MFVFPVTIIVSLLLKCLKKSESGKAGCDARFYLQIQFERRIKHNTGANEVEA